MQAVYQAARAEVEQLLRAVDGDGGSREHTTPLFLDWDALYSDNPVAPDAFGLSIATGDDTEVEPASAEDRASTMYRWGSRLSGVAFSPGGDVSMVLYDKVLQGRLSGKRHMEPLWAAAGWQMGVPVTRHEARIRRTALRELGMPGELRSCLDDPWEFLTHVKDVFAAVVGRSEACPDAVDVAWIRRVVPDEDDANRSRWPTDPTWRVVQSATFAEAPTEARRLIRRRQRGADVALLDRGLYGYLVSWVALRHPNGGEWTVSRALGEARQALDALEAQAGKDFGELVRERRHQRGLPLPRAKKVLPIRLVTSDVCAAELPAGEERTDAAAKRGAEERMEEAWLRLVQAEQRQASARELQALEAAYLHEVRTYAGTLRPATGLGDSQFI